MGAESSKAGLQGVIERAGSRVGSLAVSGRYHRLPKRLEDEYQLDGKVLGSGYNGQVHMAVEKRTKAKVAVKGFKLHGVPKTKKEELESECEIFLSMDHPHVARLIDVYESEDKLDLVMECMTGGELFKRVTERKRFTENEGADAAWQMLLALNYIHSHHVVHRDIKLENFLYDTPDSDHLKLIDFGFSKVWSPNTKMALSCGTLAYVAPEVLDQSYSSQCDMWSLGVVVFITLFGYMPFSGSEEHQVNAISLGRYTVKKEIWNKVSSKAQDFVKSLLVVDPQKRLTAHGALEHPWIQQRDLMQKAEETVDLDIVNALVDFGHASTFRRTALNMMAWSLTNDEREKVRNAFIQLDQDRTGAISIGEFKKVLELNFHINDADATQAFEALDVNQNEEIHYSEFLAAMMNARIAMHDDLLLATFRRFDTDNSGCITMANLKTVLGESFDEEEANAMIADVDTGHDGKISFQEFIGYLRNPNADQSHQDAVHKVLDQKARAARASKMRQKTQAFGGDRGTSNGKKQKGKSQQCGCCLH